MIVGFGFIAGMTVFVGAVIYAWVTRNNRRW